VIRYSIRASRDSQSPPRVCTLLEMATWVCRSGSPARESRWVNAAITKPRVWTCPTPRNPVRVYAASFSIHATVFSTAARWASSICSDTSVGATAHSVDTDLTGEKVTSNPATADWSGRDCCAMNPDRSAELAGARPCSSVNISSASAERTWARASGATMSSRPCPCSTFHA